MRIDTMLVLRVMASQGWQPIEYNEYKQRRLAPSVAECRKLGYVQTKRRGAHVACSVTESGKAAHALQYGRKGNRERT